MTGDALDQAKWRVIAAQALREDIDRELAKLLQIAALIDHELRDANAALARLDRGTGQPQSPSRLSQLQAAVEDSKPLAGILEAAVKRATA